MSVYIIKDKQGNTLNRVNASLEFVKANFAHFELEQTDVIEADPKDKALAEREWRDSELSRTDAIVVVTDRSDHDAYLAYRQKLRQYPQQDGFPDIERPQL